MITNQVGGFFVQIDAGFGLLHRFQLLGQTLLGAQVGLNDVGTVTDVADNRRVGAAQGGAAPPPQGLRGQSCNLMVIEENTQIDPKTQDTVIGPLLREVGAFMTSAGSPAPSEVNDRMQANPDIEVIIAALQCPACAKREGIKVCRHRYHLLGAVTLETLRRVLAMFVNPAMAEQELLGRGSAEVLTVFDLQSLYDWPARGTLRSTRGDLEWVVPVDGLEQHYAVPPISFVHTGVDPNGLGSHSEFGLVSVGRAGPHLVLLALDGSLPQGTTLDTTVLAHCRAVNTVLGRHLDASEHAFVVESNMGGAAELVKRAVWGLAGLGCTELRTSLSNKHVYFERVRELLSALYPGALTGIMPARGGTGTLENGRLFIHPRLLASAGDIFRSLGNRRLDRSSTTPLRCVPDDARIGGRDNLRALIAQLRSGVLSLSKGAHPQPVVTFTAARSDLAMALGVAVFSAVEHYNLLRSSRAVS